MSAWIQTWSGIAFEPLNPRVEDVRVEDIAHSLSLICRFNGHCARHYSVAEHSLWAMCAEWAEANAVAHHYETWRLEDALEAFLNECEYGDSSPVSALELLCHDRSEAYLCDLPRPLKQLKEAAFYIDAEHTVDDVTRQALHLPNTIVAEHDALVKVVDLRMLITEKRDLMSVSRGASLFPLLVEPYAHINLFYHQTLSFTTVIRLWLSAFTKLRALLNDPLDIDAKKWGLLWT